MNIAHIELENGRTAFRPGETIRGFAAWRIDRSLRRVVLHLSWRTEGVGTRNTDLAGQIVVDDPPSTGKHDFEITAPPMPHSYSGRLLSILWTLDLFTEPDTESHSVDLVISPTGEPLVPSPESDGREK
ncbi:MAG: hypothetical protein U1F77_07720 [Kiritimatiellia bacterium]